MTARELPEVLLFDLGGTLVPSWSESPTVVYANALQPPVNPDTLARVLEVVLSTSSVAPGSAEVLIGRWNRDWRKILRQLDYRGDYEEAIATIWALWIECGPLYPEVEVTLRSLRERGHRLGIVSNWAPCLDQTLGHLGIANLFECSICSAVVGVRKPDPAIFRHALQVLSVEPNMCAYVGDSEPLDVHCAQNAGIMPVLLDRGAARSDGWRVIRSLDELLAR